MKHTHARSKVVRTVPALLLVAVSGAAAFSLGIRSAEDGRTVVQTIVASDGVQGDLNRDGKLTNADATIAIEVAAGLRTATTDELTNDPNGDGVITTADALWILDHMRNEEGKRIRK